MEKGGGGGLMKSEHFYLNLNNFSSLYRNIPHLKIKGELSKIWVNPLIPLPRKNTNFFKNSLRNTISVSNSLDPDQDRHMCRS